MSENVSRVTPPRNSNVIDYDFLAFSFGGKHSYDDFGIYRVIDGDRYNDDLNPPLQDVTVETPGIDGAFYFGTTHKPKIFNINFAFDSLNETKLREMKQWLNGKELQNLWFDEAPYKVYTAKVTGTAMIKHIPFNEKNKNTGQIERIYKGEGTIQFTAYWPYAHTPDEVGVRNVNTGVINYFDGKLIDYYVSFANKKDWFEASGLEINEGLRPWTYKQNGENPGDIPAPFKLTYTDEIGAGSLKTFKVGDCSITVGGEGQSALSNVIWDSKTGMVSAKIGTSDKQVPIAYSGNSLGAIPVGGLDSDKIDLNGATLEYHYWYY